MNFFSRFFLFSVRYHFLLLAGAFVLSLLAVFQLFRTHYSADMRYLLPQNSLSVRNLEVVIDSGLANKVTLYLQRKDGEKLDNVSDMAAMTKFAEELKRLPQVRQVVCAPAGASPEEMYKDFVSHIPYLFPPSALPEGRELDSRLKENFRFLCLNPMGGALRSRYDPLGWTTGHLLKLEKVLKVSDLQFYAGNRSFLLSPDRKICMMLLYTDAAVSDYEKSISLVSDLERTVAKSLPERIRCEFFSPHMHMLENGKIVRIDLWIFAVCTSVLFLLLFAVVYKWDLRGILIPFLASLGSLWAAALMGLLFRPVLLFTLAMGGILIGIAGDYGIHLYAASLSGRRIRNGIALIPKLLLAFLTTIFAFFCFIFTEVPAFVQFGTYSALTLLFSFLLLLSLLPGFLFFRKRPRATWDFFTLLKLENVCGKHAVFSGILLLCLGIGAFFVTFDTNMSKFDVGYVKFGKREAYFQRSFGKNSAPMPILFYREKSFDALLETCRKDKEKLLKNLPGLEMVTPSDLFTPEKEKRANKAAWEKFLSSGKWEAYKNEFAAKGEKYGYTRAFFAGFFDEMEKGIKAPYEEKTPLLLSFARRNMIGKSSCWTGIALVRSSGFSAETLQKNSSGTVFSEEFFTRQLYKDISGRLPLVIPLVVLLVLAGTFLHLRSVLKTLLVFLPVAFCLIGIAGMHVFFGKEITLAVIVSGIITIGISVDYGVLLVNSDMSSHIFNAIVFSAITTAAGGMTVLFTRHPMLRSAGLTIIAGISSSCLFTIFLLYPVLKKLRAGKGAKGLLPAGVLLLPLFFSSCTSLPREERLPLLPVPNSMHSSCRFPIREKAREFQGSLLMDYKTGQAAFLVAGKMTEKGEFSFFGFSHAGIRLFTLSGEGNELKKREWAKNTVPEGRQKELSRFLYGALAAGIHAPSCTPKELHKSLTKEGGILLSGTFENGILLKCFYSGKECRIVRKEYWDRGNSRSVEFCRTPPGSDTAYLYSDKSIFQAYVKMKFYE